MLYCLIDISHFIFAEDRSREFAQHKGIENSDAFTCLSVGPIFFSIISYDIFLSSPL